MATTEHDLIFDDMCDEYHPIIDAWHEDPDNGFTNVFEYPKALRDEYDLSKADSERIFWAWTEEQKKK